jgi:putative FmdB family regulatory protein
MPIYEYKCEKCGKRFEKLQKISDPLCKKCPHCEGKLRKVMSSPAIQFKGNGFYVNDYPKKEKDGSDKKSGESETKVKPATDAKAEAKPKAEPLPADKPCSD